MTSSSVRPAGRICQLLISDPSKIPWMSAKKVTNFLTIFPAGSEHIVGYSQAKCRACWHTYRYHVQKVGSRTATCLLCGLARNFLNLKVVTLLTSSNSLHIYSTYIRYTYFTSTQEECQYILRMTDSSDQKTSQNHAQSIRHCFQHMIHCYSDMIQHRLMVDS